MLARLRGASEMRERHDPQLGRRATQEGADQEQLVGLAMQVFWICVGILIFSLAWRKAIRQYSAVAG